MASVGHKTRIIAHMDADHQASLCRYLQHYCRIPASLAADAKLDDIELDHMIITSSGGRNLIPFSPPLSSWGETRARLVEMDRVALEGLDLSDIIVTEYRRPNNFALAVFVTFMGGMIAFSRAAKTKRGSAPFRVSDLRHVDSFSGFCFTIQPLLLPFIGTMHAIEAAGMVQGRLRRHGVRRFSRLWWKWVCSNLVEGYGTVARFDQVVREGEEKKKKAGKD